MLNAVKNNQIKKCVECKSFYVGRESTGMIKGEENLCVKCLELEVRDNYKIINNGLIEEATVKFEKELNDILDTEVLEGELQIYRGKHNEDSEKRIDYGENLNEIMSKRIEEPFYGREREIQEIFTILSRKYKANPLIVGGPGVGKTTLVREVAKRLASGQVPEKMKNLTIFEVSIGSLVAGTSLRGQFEERLEGIIKQAVSQNDVVLFIDEFEQLMNMNKTDSSADAMGILKPYLADGRLRIIGATTNEGYNSKIAEDEATSRRFQRIMLKEPGSDEVINMVREVSKSLEKHHRVKISSDVIEKSIELTNRFMTDRNQPDKTIDVLDEASAKKLIPVLSKDNELSELKSSLKDSKNKRKQLVLENDFNNARIVVEEENEIINEIKSLEKEMNKDFGNRKVSFKNVMEIVENRTGIPMNLEEKYDKKMSLNDKLKSYVKGQDEAIDRISKAIRRSKYKLGDPNRPDGVFLFLGPTGVGKTELAKAISKEVYGSEIIRFDMSEFMDESSVSKLIGAPPGYIGYDNGAKLVDELRLKPYSVVLMDEVEKAHPKVLNVFLQAFEDGVLTDNKGQTVDVKNALFIMTSNAGVKNMHQKGISLGNVKKEKKNLDDLMEDVVKDNTFTPEFLNRIDGRILFNDLNEETMIEIVEGLVSEVGVRLLKEGYRLTYDESVLEKISKEGYDVKYGARESKRKVENLIDIILDQLEVESGNNIHLEIKDEDVVCNIT